MLHSLIDLIEQRKKELEEEKIQSAQHNAEMYGKFLDYEHQLVQAKSDVRVLDSRYQKAKAEISNIVEKYENSIDDKELINRLTNEYIDNKT